MEIGNLGIRQIVVPEDDKDPTTNFSERVTNGYTDVVKGDVSRSGSWRVASLDVARFDSRSALNQDDSETILTETSEWMLASLLSKITSVLHPTVKLVERQECSKQSPLPNTY